MGYSAKDIEIKGDMEHVRIRPRVYLGDYVYTTAVREIVDNASDEVVRGYGTDVYLEFHDDGSIEVRDNGRGIPVDYDNTHKLNGIEKALANLRAGSNFGSGAGNTAGTNGMGATACNAVSVRFDVTVYRDGLMYIQQFHLGIAGEFKGNDFDPNAPFTKNPHQKLKGKKAPKGSPSHGTTIRFYLDQDVVPDDELDVDEVISRLNYVARLTPGMKVTIVRDGQTTTFEGPDYGISEVLKFQYNTDPLFTVEGSTSYSMTTNKITGDKRTKGLDFELSVVPATPANSLTLVNSVLTPEGGSHENFTAKALGSAAAAKRLRTVNLNAGEDYPRAEDFAATASFALNIKTPEPPFSGQDKRKIKSTALGNALEKEVERMVTAWVVSPVNADALLTWTNLALEHARTTRKVEAARAAAKAKSGTRKQTGNLALPDKFLPCLNTGYDSGSEVHLCEGDSAAGSVEAARDSEYQACFPLRGKQINSFNTPLGPQVPSNLLCNPRKKGEKITMRTNESFVAIERILGAGARDHCIPENCRFSRIVYSTDADPDGANISAQLMCMFYFNFRPLLEAGMVYVAVPPLFVITSNLDNERYYALNELERDSIREGLEKMGAKRVFIKRCKGLGEMNEDEFFDTVMDPFHRRLRRVVIDENTLDMLDMAFGSSPEKRRDFLDEMADRGETADVDTM